MANTESGKTPRTRIRCGALLAAIKDVTGVVAGRSTVPILEFVRFSCTDGGIELITTDLDMWATRTLASDIMGQPDSPEWKAGTSNFTIAVPAKPLEALLGQIDPDAMVTLIAPSGTETRAVIKAGRARFKLACLPVEDFPLVPPGGDDAGASFEMPASGLADLFAAVEHAISTEETRYYLNGIYLHPADLTLRGVATDGHRLARIAIDAPDGAASFTGAIISRWTVAVLDKLLARAAKTDDAAQVVVEAEGQIGQFGAAARLRFTMPASDDGTVELLAKTVDGTFPDYARVIPTEVETTARLNRTALIDAIKRVSTLGDGKTRIVACDFSADKLTLTASTIELGEAAEEMPADYPGAPLKVGMDSRYLLAALQALACDTVALGMSGAGGPVRLRAGDGDDGTESERLVQVVMPVRV